PDLQEKRPSSDTHKCQVSTMNLQKSENVQQLIPGVQMGPSQVGPLANLLGRIFHNEANFEYLFPDEEARRIVLPSFFRSAIRAGRLYGEIHTTENQEGVAVWIRPEHNVPFRQLLRTRLPEVHLKVGFDQYTARYMKLSASVEEVRKHLAPNPHWY